MALKACSNSPCWSSILHHSPTWRTQLEDAGTHTQTLSQEVVLKVQKTDAHSAGVSRGKLKASKGTRNATVTVQERERAVKKLNGQLMESKSDSKIQIKPKRRLQPWGCATKVKFLSQSCQEKWQQHKKKSWLQQGEHPDQPWWFPCREEKSEAMCN